MRLGRFVKREELQQFRNNEVAFVVKTGFTLHPLCTLNVLSATQQEKKPREDKSQAFEEVPSCCRGRVKKYTCLDLIGPRTHFRK